MTPSALIDKLERRRRLIGEIIEGLRGRPFTWGSGEYSSRSGMLTELGINLMTKTRVGGAGHRLKRGVRPVGSVYFDAPIQRRCPVYLYKVQTVPLTPRPLTSDL